MFETSILHWTPLWGAVAQSVERAPSHQEFMGSVGTPGAKATVQVFSALSVFKRQSADTDQYTYTLKVLISDDLCEPAEAQTE